MKRGWHRGSCQLRSCTADMAGCRLAVLWLSSQDDERFSPDELDAMLRDLQQMQAFT
jgi:hypothetical protein